MIFGLPLQTVDCSTLTKSNCKKSISYGNTIFKHLEASLCYIIITTVFSGILPSPQNARTLDEIAILYLILTHYLLKLFILFSTFIDVL